MKYISRSITITITELLLSTIITELLLLLLLLPTFPGDQNRAEDRYEEEAYNPNEEGQHVFQSLSLD